MRSIRKPKTQRDRRYRRHLRVRKKINGTGERPRLVVFRSLRHTYAQLVDDERGITLVGTSDLSSGVSAEEGGKVGAAFAVGKSLATRAKELGVERAVFDRAGYLYHGRVKAVADGAREGGLEF
jgi:large subunit ribosomal protein L18